MQPADVEEVVEKGVQTLVIGRGMSEALKVGIGGHSILRTVANLLDFDLRDMSFWELSLYIMHLHFAGEPVDVPG